MPSNDYIAKHWIFISQSVSFLIFSLKINIFVYRSNPNNGDQVHPSPEEFIRLGAGKGLLYNNSNLMTSKGKMILPCWFNNLVFWNLSITKNPMPSYIRYVLDRLKANRRQTDPHWRPQHLQAEWMTDLVSNHKTRYVELPKIQSLLQFMIIINISVQYIGCFCTRKFTSPKLLSH